MKKVRFEAEKEFSKILNRQNKKWIYEPKRFVVDNSHYIPDFYLPKENKYYEVMGSRQAYYQKQFKLKRFQKLYPHIILIVVDRKGFLFPKSKETKIKFSNLKKSLSIKIGNEQYQKLKEIAKIRKVSESELIRTIIWLYTDKIKK